MSNLGKEVYKPEANYDVRAPLPISSSEGHPQWGWAILGADALQQCGPGKELREICLEKWARQLTSRPGPCQHPKENSSPSISEGLSSREDAGKVAFGSNASSAVL